jgi:signal transduction histidine kinase
MTSDGVSYVSFFVCRDYNGFNSERNEGSGIVEISDKLAIELNTILLSHFLTLTLLVLFTAYVFSRAKKTVFLYAYLSTVGTIALWIIAKIFKTVSPVIELRWLFVVIQYLAIDCMGICLIVFAYIYRKGVLPPKTFVMLLSIAPAVAFITLATNPLHMTFYTYFDLYRDRFGISFYIAHSIQYIYLIIGIVMLASGYTKQPQFHKKRSLGRIFSFVVLLPMLWNMYYILFKLDLLLWIFHFPVFDASPLAASFSLMLFTIPTLKYRFFDLSPISFVRLYETLPQGIVFCDENLRLYGANSTFYSMLACPEKPPTLSALIENSQLFDKKSALALMKYGKSEGSEDIPLTDGRWLGVTAQRQDNGGMLLCFGDKTDLIQNRTLLTKQRQELEGINQELSGAAKAVKKLNDAKIKTQTAQNVHDILGHNLTVAIGTAELASSSEADEASKKISQIEEVLKNSLTELGDALDGKSVGAAFDTIKSDLEQLKSENIHVDIKIHGQEYRLSPTQHHAVYQLCREAVTNAIRHGQAKNMYLILRFSPAEIDIYAVDDGIGCFNIIKNYGLSGIETEIKNLSGLVEFTSDGEAGFTVHAKLPRDT